MANWWDQLGTGMGDALIGMQNPFGFAPPENFDRQQAIRSGALNLGMNIMAQPYAKPMEAVGKAYGATREQAGEASKQAFMAQQMMMEADAKKKERARAEARQKWIDDEIAKLPVDQQGMARMLPEKFFGEQIEAQFPDPSSEKVYGNMYFDDQGNPLVLDSAGNLRRPGGIGDNTRVMDPYSTSYNKSRGSTTGKEDAEAAVAAPGDIAAADIALGKIEELRTDPNRGIGTGKSAVFNNIPATPGYDYQTKVDEVTAGAFLTAIQQMRGLGALSNAEGQTARQAVTRIKTATSEEAFLDALADYEEIVMMGRERAKKRLSPGASAPASAADNNDPLGLR